MRIISGERRGHKLLEFCGDDIRPTTDRVKESIFNLIQEYVSEANVLDMFCGSGALSFEALSRGAAFATCIDLDKNSINVIKRNCSDLNYSDRCEIINCSCFDYIKKCGKKFDLIFLDPPYNKNLIEDSLRGIAKSSILSPNGIIVLESDSTDFHSDFENLTMLKQRKYGRTYITVYKYCENWFYLLENYYL